MGLAYTLLKTVEQDVSRARKISVVFYPDISALRFYLKETFQSTDGKIFMHKYIMIGGLVQ